MSPVIEMPPQPRPPGARGKSICPINEVVGLVGRAMPKAKLVLAPKKRWKVILVRGSANSVVLSAKVVGMRARRRAVIVFITVRR